MPSQNIPKLESDESTLRLAVLIGELANQILAAMEAALSRHASQYSVYGSTTHKQVYLYGGLDRSPTTLSRGYGTAWGVGGFPLPNHLGRIGQAEVGKLFGRVRAG